MTRLFSPSSSQQHAASIYRIPRTVSAGSFDVDFVVYSEKENKRLCGIEIDGHEFHEKTKEQATHDKKRERAIVLSGLTILRFTGSEIVRKCKSCIDEVKQFITLD